jgi:hypothetical protein
MKPKPTIEFTEMDFDWVLRSRSAEALKRIAKASTHLLESNIKYTNDGYILRINWSFQERRQLKELFEAPGYQDMTEDEIVNAWFGHLFEDMT